MFVCSWMESTFRNPPLVSSSASPGAQLVSRGPLAVAAVKQCFARNRDVDIETAIMVENEAATACFVSADQKEGLRAQRGQQTLDLGRREIRAAFDGVIDQTFIDAGEFVTAGTRLLMYHNPSEIWIDVNIKETDVRKITVGAPARVKIDAYPGQVFDARVSEVGGAATSQFALLPNPNPSGNFTKVTQRIPVRLEIVQQHIPLRPGMMVEATIDVVD